MTDYCIECSWFSHLDCTCTRGNEKRKKIDTCCEHFLPSQLFRNDCVTCIYSRKLYEKTPEGVLISDSVFYRCEITHDEYKEFHLPERCLGFEIRPFVEEERLHYIIEDFLPKCKMRSRFNHVQFGGNYDDL